MYIVLHIANPHRPNCGGCPRPRPRPRPRRSAEAIGSGSAALASGLSGLSSEMKPLPSQSLWWLSPKPLDWVFFLWMVGV